ncbi:hypothetical protein K502DRAFT_314454 [Neoconidiobolus thromboides FSU 785]|nr:hypothetical protein K502DRAFT_314454 [Neoconidiobolus thromboides FSU 785]
MAMRMSNRASSMISSSYDPSNLSDLTELPDVTVSSISTCLSSRYQLREYYTNLGSRVLLSVNPFKEGDSLNYDQVLKDYLANYRNFQDDKENMQPHIFKLASTIYFHLRRSALDQSVIFCGSVGSGKSENKKLFLKAMAGLRSASKKESKLYTQIINSEQIFECFGSTFTSSMTKASRFAKYIELQFDNRGRTIGVKHLDYLLEKNRLSDKQRGESNFLVFYQFLAGITEEEKNQFQLKGVSQYQYLIGTFFPYSFEELKEQFLNLKLSLKNLGFTKKFQSQIFQLLASILHLGNIKFYDRSNKDEEGGALVMDYDVLSLAADFLGLHPTTLEGLLTYRTQVIKKETCTMFLDSLQASKQKDELAKCLYSLLFSWITEHINTRLCFDQQSNFIGILDLPGFQKLMPTSGFEQFCINFSNERLYNYMLYQIFEASNDAYDEDDIFIPKIDIVDNQNIVQLLTKSSNGLVSILSKQANRSKGPANDTSLLQAIQKAQENNSILNINLSLNQFTINHFQEPVIYDIIGFMENNMDSINPDFVQTFRGEADVAVSNSFISGLFNHHTISTQVNPKDNGNIVSAQKSALPRRTPSMKRARIQQLDENGEFGNKQMKINCVANQLKVGLDELFDTFDNTETWFVLCLCLSDSTNFNSESMENQLKLYKLDQMVLRKKMEYTICYLHEEFVLRYNNLLIGLGINTDQKFNEICEVFKTTMNWNNKNIAIGNQYIYLNELSWVELENGLRNFEHGTSSQKFGLVAPGMITDDNQSFYSDDDNNGSELDSQLGDSSQIGDLELIREKGDLELIDEDEELNKKPPKTTIRKLWILLTWLLTWWVPSFMLSCCGRMKLKDVKMAWREKVALCILIFLMSGFVVLFIVGVNPLLCPERDIYTVDEVASTKESTTSSPLYHLYGRVYELYGIAGLKTNGHRMVSTQKMIENFGGSNIDDAFPIQINPNLCLRFDGNEIDPQISLSNKTNNPNFINHDHRYYRGERNYSPYWFENVIRYHMKKVGDIAYTLDTITKKAAEGRKMVLYQDKDDKKSILRVFDFTPYFNLFVLPRDNEQSTSLKTEGDFLGSDMTQIINNNSGKDISDLFKQLFKDDLDTKKRIEQCMNNLFYAGLVDDRNSPQCIFAQYLLLALSIFLFAILFVKFLASLQLGSRPEPEDHDKFVVCNVPCYTEDLESLKRTIDSLAVLKYDDKRKLLFIISDGMVIGGGNELPTPRILLNLLGSDPSLDPEPLSFLSLGEGSKQHNMGKVYTGLYEIRGHVVPYIVIVKVGKPSERVKPGNRGKRDSQLILMKFFNKVHYDHPMVPLELEMYHQIKNVIGVDPHLYEFILMVDADTVVMPDSLNRLVSAMLHDIKIMGICGETSIMNERDSWATMIQVYEYYMSHHLAKAFESLFGSVTCLPGCFSMYRVKSPDNDSPLLIHDCIINQYSENQVNTLHKKNLFHLGEDRYLTTLMLKNFPFNKLTFTPDAKCLTNAPDTWEVLLSQRRRWINSTVHNLLELVFLPRLCGFCCFSMRFVVFMDLLSTIIMPATLGYLGYLIYRLASDRTKAIPVASLVFIAAPYVLQMLVFLIRRQWQQIGWMVVYLMALPIFAFFIPLYSFWHFDDFSWGNTRVVLGEGGKKKKVAVDEGIFDPQSIPTRKWSEYEEENWEKETEKTSYSHHSSPSANSLNKPPMTNASPIPFSIPAIDAIPMMPIMQQQQNYRPMSTFSSMPYMATMMANEYVPNYPMASNSSVYKGSRPASPSFKPMKVHTPPQSQSMTPPLLPNFQPGPEFPNHQDIIVKIRMILAESDLMAVSKKQVRVKLSEYFGVELDAYKEQVNYWIELVLKGQL